MAVPREGHDILVGGVIADGPNVFDAVVQLGGDRRRHAATIARRTPCGGEPSDRGELCAARGYYLFGMNPMYLPEVEG